MLAITCSTLRANTIYNVVNDAPDQNGYTVTGTITTDGYIGILTSADFKDIEITISNGSSSTTLSSIPGPPYSTATDVTATANGIFVAQDGQLRFSVIAPDIINTQAQSALINWYPSNLPYERYRARDLSGNLLFDVNPPSSPDFSSGSPWEIAKVQSSSAVPEPSSFALLVLGGLGLAFRAYRRRATSV